MFLRIIIIIIIRQSWLDFCHNLINVIVDLDTVTQLKINYNIILSVSTDEIEMARYNKVHYSATIVVITHNSRPPAQKGHFYNHLYVQYDRCKKFTIKLIKEYNWYKMMSLKITLINFLC